MEVCVSPPRQREQCVVVGSTQEVWITHVNCCKEEVALSAFPKALAASFCSSLPPNKSLVTVLLTASASHKQSTESSDNVSHKRVTCHRSIRDMPLFRYIQLATFYARTALIEFQEHFSPQCLAKRSIDTALLKWCSLEPGLFCTSILLQLRLQPRCQGFYFLRCSDLANCRILGDEIANSLSPGAVEHDGKLVELSLISADACQDVF